MTNGIEKLSAINTEYITNTLTNVIHISTKETKELLNTLVSHTQYIQRLDWVIIVCGIITGLSAITATVIVGITIHKYWSYKQESDKIKEELTNRLNTLVSQETKEIAEIAKKQLKELSEHCTDLIMEFLGKLESNKENIGNLQNTPSLPLDIESKNPISKENFEDDGETKDD